MGVTSIFIEVIQSAFRKIREFVSVVINRVLNFARDIVDWFKKTIKGDETIVLIDLDKLPDLIKNAPVHDVGLRRMMQCTYDERTNEITNHRIVEAEGVDEQTREIMGDEPLVVLT